MIVMWININNLPPPPPPLPPRLTLFLLKFLEYPCPVSLSLWKQQSSKNKFEYSLVWLLFPEHLGAFPKSVEHLLYVRQGVPCRRHTWVLPVQPSPLTIENVTWLLSNPMAAEATRTCHLRNEGGNCMDSPRLLSEITCREVFAQCIGEAALFVG